MSPLVMKTIKKEDLCQKGVMQVFPVAEARRVWGLFETICSSKARNCKISCHNQLKADESVFG